MEYIKRCKVCGHIFCYTDKDVSDNTVNAVAGVFGALGQIGAALGGTMLDMHVAASQNERIQNKITDFNKCPVCHSTNLEFITREELNKMNSAPAVKNAPEIKINTNASAESLLKRANLFLEDEEWDMASAYCDAVLDMEPENAEAYLGKLLAELKVSKKEKLINQFEPFSDNINYKKVVRFANNELKNEVLGYINSINVRKKNARLEKLYNEAKNTFNSACSSNDFKSAAEKFKLVASYKDSDELYSKCIERVEEERIKEKEKAEIERAEAEKKAEADRIAAEARKKKTKKIATIVTPIVALAIAAVVIFTTVIQPMMDYNSAVALMEDGKYEEAITAFEAMDGYKDSSEQIVNCENEILEQDYQSAVALMKEEKYEEEVKIFNSIKKYKDSDELSKESSYLTANKLIEEKKYNEALPILKNIGNYKDSKEIEKEINIFAEIETLKEASVGEVVSFGEKLYKSVKWRVLEKEGDGILLITEECIASRMYNDTEKEVTWGTCTLRTWLNDDFINSTFSDKEKALIVTTNVTNESEYGKVGKNTKDKIFLLSKEEAEKYFVSDKSRATGWDSVGGLTLDDNVPAWWLRTPGVFGNDTVCVVEYDGSINMLGDNVTSNDVYGYKYVGGVRPAMWIDLSAIE